VGRQFVARDIRYEDRATQSIQVAKQKWAHIEDVVNAVEWALLHDPHIGCLLNERGIRGFVMPGARSIDEPDVDVLYEESSDELIVIHDLIFRQAKAQYSGNA
jgi:hypothetical protein